MQWMAEFSLFCRRRLFFTSTPSSSGFASSFNNDVM